MTRKMRKDALIRTLTHLIDTHQWTLAWDSRGLRLTHDAHTLVLGVPATFGEYVSAGLSSSSGCRAPRRATAG